MSQYTCQNRYSGGPPGCLQYFYDQGLSKTGVMRCVTWEYPSKVRLKPKRTGCLKLWILNPVFLFFSNFGFDRSVTSIASTSKLRTKIYSTLCIPLTKHLFFLQLLISVTRITISASGVCQDVIQSVIIRPLLDPLVSRKIDWKLSLTLLFQNNSATFWAVKRLKWA